LLVVMEPVALPKKPRPVICCVLLVM